MKENKLIVKLTKGEHDEIKQIHHLKMGLLEMIGIADERKEKFVRRIAKKYKFEEGMVAIDIRNGRVKKR